MTGWFLGALIALASVDGLQEPPRAPLAVVAHQEVDDAPVRIEDVQVSGRTLRDQTTAFVGEVSAPPPQRGLARWTGALCVGVVNLKNDAAQALIDHVSSVAQTYGVRIREPGCSPNVVIIFTDEAPALALEMVSQSPNAFRIGSSQTDRGSKALRAFQTSESPVRWWHVSMPIVGATGQRAIRVPGDNPDSMIQIAGEGLVNKGRPISDQLTKAILIVDVEKIGEAALPQLADYLAMVALAQVDPAGETQGFETILNLFDNPRDVTGLSGWDHAYLASLYGAYSERVNPSDQAAAMARGIMRAERNADREAVQQH